MFACLTHTRMANELQNVLNAHDRVRKSTDLPLFYGKKEKETVSPHVLLDRINRASVIAGWNTDERKCTEFYMILRDRALIWWDSLENCDNVNREVWADVQREFLAAYEPKFTARTTCTNFQDLVQRSGENVHDYYLRVTEALKKMCDAKPDTIHTVRIDRGGASAAEAAAIKREGVLDSERFFMHQLFIAGLKEEIRTKIMEAGKTSIQDSVTLARELEVIMNDRKKSGNVANVKTTHEQDIQGEEYLEEEELTAINAVRFQKGKPPLRFVRGPERQVRSAPPQRSQQQQNFNSKCRYCKIPGHQQKVCRKRILAGAPCVDINGKPYPIQDDNRVQTVQSRGGETQTPGPSETRSQLQDPYYLNW